jgi:hypothetical protein
MVSQETSILGSIQRAPSGRYYSFHFWLYPLLAAPFLWAVRLAGLTPLLALPLVNATAVLGASFYAASVLSGKLQYWVPIAFLLCGTTYYLHWSGPEALTASAAFVSALAAMQGQRGHAALAAGIAAAHNPGALALVILIGGWGFLLRRDPKNTLFGGGKLRRIDRVSVVCALGGGVIALLSPLFFLVTFGEPSLIAKQAVDVTLATPGRLFSLLFDLNQGLLVGIPGLLVSLGIAIAVVFNLRSPSQQRLLYLALGLGALTTLLAALPSLGTLNWNSGCSVFMRYAYWASMPLLVAVLGVAARLADSVRSKVVWPGALVQALALSLYGISGTSAAYTRHGPVARFVMAHFPAFYNPEPEVFFERSLGREARPTAYAAVAWPNKQQPTKILVAPARPITWPELCGGQPFEAASIARAGDDAQYLNGPFRCKDPR